MPRSRSRFSSRSRPSSPWPGRFALLLAGLVLLYGAAAGGFWLLQDWLVYRPDRGVVVPDADWIDTVSISTEDGETLRGWYAAPQPGCPVFLFLDGHAGQPQIQAGRWGRMRERGAGFLAVSWRGYPGSTGSASADGLQRDAEAGYDWLLAQGHAPQDMVVHGFSLGSGPATRLAADRETGLLVLEAPYYSMSDLLRERFVFLPVGLLNRNRFRSDLAMRQVTEPVFIAHGTADNVVPPDQSERLAGEIRHDRGRRETFAGAGHATLVRDGLYDRLWAAIPDLMPPLAEGRCDQLSAPR